MKYYCIAYILQQMRDGGIFFYFLCFTVICFSLSLICLSLSSGWLAEAKVSCILCYQGIQLILAYSWARPATLAAGGGRGGMFLLFLFLHFHSFSSFSPVPLFHSSTISSISFLPFSRRRHKMTHKGWCVVKPQHNQSVSLSSCPLSFFLP